MIKNIIKIGLKSMVENDVESLIALFKEYPEIINYKFFSNRNWLHESSKYEVPDIIDMLGNFPEIDIEATDKFGRTPLCSALIGNKLIPTKKLIELGANVNHYGSSSPLSCAVYSQSKKLLKLLIENGANNESKEELIRYGRGQGYKNIEEDLNELNYVSAITESFKDKLSAHYGALTDVQSKQSPCILYSKEAKGKFAVFTENISKDAEIMFEVTKQGFDTAEEVLTQSYPWLFDWLEVINQVEIDPTQRFIVIEREYASKPYQGILLLQDSEITINSSTETIYRLFPLHQAEVDFEKQHSMVNLIKEFERVGLSEVIVNNRQSII